MHIALLTITLNLMSLFLNKILALSSEDWIKDTDSIIFSVFILVVADFEAYRSLFCWSIGYTSLLIC